MLQKEVFKLLQLLWKESLRKSGVCFIFTVVKIKVKTVCLKMLQIHTI
jgi:hypothetical protein